MKLLAEHNHEQDAESPLETIEGDARGAVLRELEGILQSSFFFTSKRCKQFLAFVVEKRIENNVQDLKERIIGAVLFGRSPDYPTGEDPVVRVQAGHVRRRLENYYQQPGRGTSIRIVLPLGSYTPEFHFAQAHTSPSQPLVPNEQGMPAQSDPSSSLFRRSWVIGLACLVIVLAGVLMVGYQRRLIRTSSAFEQFWEPAFASPQPTMICLAKVATYRPKEELIEEYTSSHPGALADRAEQAEEPLPLPDDKAIRWDQLLVNPDYGVASGDVYAAASMASTFGRYNKSFQLRIGTNYSFDDLHHAPAILVGAFNNKWTLRITSKLHYTFVDLGHKLLIVENTPGGAQWPSSTSKQDDSQFDYALICRLLDSKTGQFTVVVGGIRGAGTQGASELVSNKPAFEKVLNSLPSGWQTKNLELVLEVPVTDSLPEPAKVIASWAW
jgi:hypothetical protein